MSDEEIQLRLEVCLAPEDNRPRLRFADWLDRRGFSNWADFIRLSIEFDSILKPYSLMLRDSYFSTGQMEQKLVNRWRDLFEVGVEKYLSLPLPSITSGGLMAWFASFGLLCDWRRGFPFRLRMDYPTSAANTPELLFRLMPLEMIKCSEVRPQRFSGRDYGWNTNFEASLARRAERASIVPHEIYLKLAQCKEPNRYYKTEDAAYLDLEFVLASHVRSKAFKTTEEIHEVERQADHLHAE